VQQKAEGQLESERERERERQLINTIKLSLDKCRLVVNNSSQRDVAGRVERETTSLWKKWLS